MSWLYLAVAIVAEVAATTTLKMSEGFTRPLPAGITVVGYTLAFYFLALTLREIPVGIAYAIWSGVGIVIITLVGALLFGQRLDPAGMAGIGLILAGVLVLKLFSQSGA